MSDPLHEPIDQLHEVLLAEGRALSKKLGIPDCHIEAAAEGFALGIYWKLADKCWELLMERGPEVLGEPSPMMYDAIRLIKDWERYDRMLARLSEVRSWDDLLATP